MNESQRDNEVCRWWQYACEDFRAANTVSRSRALAPRLACEHAQQAVEKALKAVLIFCWIDYPRTHDLNELRNLIPTGWVVKERFPDLAEIGQWTTEARYPSILPDATKENARSAVLIMRAVMKTLREDFSNHGFSVDL